MSAPFEPLYARKKKSSISKLGEAPQRLARGVDHDVMLAGAQHPVRAEPRGASVAVDELHRLHVAEDVAGGLAVAPDLGDGRRGGGRGRRHWRAWTATGAGAATAGVAKRPAGATSAGAAPSAGAAAARGRG